MGSWYVLTLQVLPGRMIIELDTPLSRFHIYGWGFSTTSFKSVQYRTGGFHT